MPLGISRQLAGEAAFGAVGFQYCGSILSHPAQLFEHGVSIAARAHALAAAVTQDYPLVGVNGIDFMARRGVAYPVEVNPRWCASVELVERAHGFSMFGLHADACSRGTLPDDRIPLCLRRAVGKAIVFARADLIAGPTSDWLWYRDVADVGRTTSPINNAAVFDHDVEHTSLLHCKIISIKTISRACAPLLLPSPPRCSSSPQLGRVASASPKLACVVRRWEP